MIEFVQNAFHYGGGIMWVILAFLIVTLSLGLWRGYLVFFVYDTPNPKGLWAEVYKLVTNNQIEVAIRLCQKNPKNQALPRIFKKGLQAASRTPDEMHNAVESATLERVPLFKRFLSLFGSIANITTLLGLVGTIMGLIKGFSAVAELSGSAKNQALADSISHALYATLFGLGTALVAYTIHSVIVMRADALSDSSREYASKLVELLEMRRNNLREKAAKKAARE